MKPATLETFEAAYGDDDDPWRTFTAQDEAVKRQAILRALGPGCWGRVLELGAGVGANSLPLSHRALRLDATDGSEKSVRLIGQALEGRSHARALRLALPARFPRATYDAIVIAELLYYLSPHAMQAVARATRRALRPGSRLVLAHHHVDFHDFAQRAAGIHHRFLSEMGRDFCALGRAVRTGRWTVRGYTAR